MSVCPHVLTLRLHGYELWNTTAVPYFCLYLKNVDWKFYQIIKENKNDKWYCLLFSRFSLNRRRRNVVASAQEVWRSKYPGTRGQSQPTLSRTVSLTVCDSMVCDSTWVIGLTLPCKNFLHPLRWKGAEYLLEGRRGQWPCVSSLISSHILIDFIISDLS